MIQLTKRVEFCAAHYYVNPAWTAEENRRVFGKDGNLHGHNYVLEVTIQGDPSPETGMVMDLKAIKDLIVEAAAVPETVMDGETGLLVDPKDPTALARAIADLLSDPDLRRGMGEAGRRRVEQYRADRVASSFLSSVRSALDGLAATRRQPQMAPGVSLAVDGRDMSRASAGGRR